MPGRFQFCSCVAATWLFACLISVQAQSLTDALVQAKHNDPIYLSAQADLAVAHERTAQARAGLLPQFSATAGNNWAHRDYETLGSPFPPEVTDYQSRSAQLNLTQPLWRPANIIGLNQSGAAVAQGEYQVLAAEQDLKIRLAQAWFDSLQANDAVIHAERREAAAQLQWEQLNRASQLDLAGGPKLAEARAKYDQSVAEKIAAAAEYSAKLAQLEEIVGATLNPRSMVLSDKCSLPNLNGDRLEQWIEVSETNNPNVLAARQALEAAGEEVRKQRAGHEPTVDLVGTYSRSNQGTGNFPGQNGYDIKQRSVGIQLTVPLYSGGMQHAKVREAVALRSKAEQDLQSAMRTARSTAKVAWYSSNASKARESAALQVLKSAALALQAASVGAKTGLKFELDVLQAKEEFLSAWKDLQRARYDALLNAFKLRAAAGQLADADFEQVDQSLRSCAVASNDVDAAPSAN